MTEAVSPYEGSPHEGLSLDFRGMKCPRPIIEIARHIGEIPIGALVELLADDPAAGPDLAAWCRMRGQTLIASDPPRFVVRRES
jgi:tRNA 2-thiouridine synthesizing protein A